MKLSKNNKGVSIYLSLLTAILLRVEVRSVEYLEVPEGKAGVQAIGIVVKVVS